MVFGSGSDYPCVEVTLTIPGRPPDARKITISEKCLVDTGFSGYLRLSEKYAKDAKSVGAKLFPHTWVVATGEGVETSMVLALVDKIEGFVPSTPIRASVTLCGGSTIGLLGRELLKTWVAEFHGPRSLLSVYREAVS